MRNSLTHGLSVIEARAQLLWTDPVSSVQVTRMSRARAAATTCCAAKFPTAVNALDGGCSTSQLQMTTHGNEDRLFAPRQEGFNSALQLRSRRRAAGTPSSQCLLRASKMNTTTINTVNNMNNNEEVTTNCHFISEENISQGDWLSLARITYLDQRGIPRVWEGATRLTRNESTKIDAVGVIAFYRRLLHYDCIVLVKQYRPALKAYTIEMPAGLVEQNESPDIAAVRELKEATGFSGTIKKIGPVLAMDPGASNCAMRLVTVEVNGDEPENLHLRSNVNNERFKEPLLVPVSELLEKLSAFAAAGFIIDSRIDAFAIGLVMGNHSRKTKIPTSLM